MKIAILLGQSEYINVTKLPSCKNDLSSMKNVIEATKNFDQVFSLDDTVKTASDAKAKIIEFINNLEGKVISDLLFYFSGHGDFDGDDFYYVWNDYSLPRKRQTCLQNSEIDTLLRKLNPNLLIKIVDACNSGISYLKDKDIVKKYLKTSEEQFKKCYFLFSSQEDQFSFANISISYFTSAVLKSLNQDVGSIIRYKDIIDFVSDEFETNGNQTPFFITQADFTEVFCTVSESLKLVMNKTLIPISIASTSDPSNSNTNQLIHQIQKEAAKYVSLETAIACVKKIHDVAENFTLISEINNCFSKSIVILKNYDSIPSIDSIANWIIKNGSDTFCKIEYVTESYTKRVPKNSLFPARAFLRDEDDDEFFRTVTKTRTLANGMKSNIEIPNHGVLLNLVSKFPNLLNTGLYIIPVLARTHLYLFFSRVNYIRVNWDEQKINRSDIKWNYMQLEYIPDTIAKVLSDEITKYLQNSLKEDLEKRYLVDLDQSKNATQSDEAN